MGGISFMIYTNTNLNIDYIKCFMDIKHRGPDDSNYIILHTDNINILSDVQKQTLYLTLTRDELRTYKQYNFVLAYHRLIINDTSYNASQPFEDPIQHKILKYKELRSRPDRKLICNGEIYNYKTLVSKNAFIDKDLSSECDVEVILPMFIKYGIEDTLLKLNGEFSFVITENINTYQLSQVNTYVARDYIGFKSLYYIKNVDSSFVLFVSEIKALPSYIIQNSSYHIMQVPPGTYWSFNNTIMNNNNSFIEYNSLDKYKDLSNCTISSTQEESLIFIYNNIKDILTQSIIERYTTSHKKVGVLLSGGFDSSIITSILVKYLVSINHDFTLYPLHIFTVGDRVGDEIDVIYATNLVKFLEDKYSIDLHHHIVNINDIQILASDIEKIIYHLESFEPETVRESIPYYFLMRYIHDNTDIKVLLSGDGIDEICAYPEFIDLNDEEFQLKSVELLQNMHIFDLLRIDKISNAFSLEIRQPFLDKKFIEFMLSMHPKLKRRGVYSNIEDPIDKYIIRKSFDDEYLLPNILWRKHNCICESLTNFELRLNNYLLNIMTDTEYDKSLYILLNESDNNINTTPKNKEEMYYRLIFRKLYPTRDNLITKFWDSVWNS